MTNHPPDERPGEVIGHDIGGWISGPSAGIEPVPASEVRRGDVLAHDGRVLTVVAGPSGAWYNENGQRVAGLAIRCRSGSARWTLYRRASEILHRVAP